MATTRTTPQSIILLLTIFLCNSIYATTYTWTGNNSSNWFDSGNWDLGSVPSDGDEVIINSGFASTNNGSITLSGLTINNGGTLDITLNSILTLNGMNSVNAGGSIISRGQILLNSNMDVDGDLTLSDGSVTGGGDLIINGTLTWTNGVAWVGNTGQFMNNGTINVTGGARIRTTLINSGTINLNGTSQFVLETGGHIVNLSMIDIQDNSGFNEFSDTDEGILNQGIILKTGGVEPGISMIQTRLFNNGTVESQSGELRLARSGIHGGDFISNTPGYINFDGRDTLVGGNILGGSGSAIVDDGGTIFLQGNVDAVNLTIDQGEIYGSGDLFISGDFDFLRGRLGHNTLTTGDIYANGTLQLGGETNSSPTIYTKLSNNGTATQIRTLVLNESSEFINHGTLDIQNDSDMNGSSSSAIQIVNNGIITKSGSGGFYSEFFVFLLNYGTINVQVGELRLRKGADNLGTINISNGATLSHIGSNSVFTNTSLGQIVGHGDFLAEAEVINNGSISPGSSPGTLTFNTGNNFNLSDSTIFNMEIGGTTLGIEYDHLVLNGTVSLAGLLNVELIDGFTPALNDTFVLIDYTSLSGWFDKGINACTGVDSLEFQITDSGSEIIATVVATAPLPTTNVSICFGDSLLIYDIFRHSEGTYYDSLQTTFSCDSILSTSLTVNMVNTDIFQNGNTITSKAVGAVYQWINCDDNAPINGEVNQSYTPSNNGDYAVIVTENGCADTSICTTISVTGISENNGADQMKIFPNPVNQFLTVDLARVYENAWITIYNITGEQVSVQSVTDKNTLVDLRNFNMGVYFIKIQNGISSMTKKIIKL